MTLSSQHRLLQQLADVSEVVAARRRVPAVGALPARVDERPGEAVLFRRVEWLLRPAERWHLFSRFRPFPDSFILNVVARNPKFASSSPRETFDHDSDIRPLALRFNTEQARVLLFAHFSRLDPADPVVRDEVAIASHALVVTGTTL